MDMGKRITIVIDDDLDKKTSTSSSKNYSTKEFFM